MWMNYHLKCCWCDNHQRLQCIFLHTVCSLGCNWQLFSAGSDNGLHDDVIKWKHFPRNWPFVRGIHRSPVNSPHKGQWRGALMFTLICARINGWVNTREAGDLRRYRPHYDVIVMGTQQKQAIKWTNDDTVHGHYTASLGPNHLNHACT